MLIKKQTRGKLQKNKYFDNKRRILGEIKSIFRSFFKCFPLVKYKKIANTSLWLIRHTTDLFSSCKDSIIVRNSGYLFK